MIVLSQKGLERLEDMWLAFMIYTGSQNEELLDLKVAVEIY